MQDSYHQPYLVPGVRSILSVADTLDSDSLDFHLHVGAEGFTLNHKP